MNEYYNINYNNDETDKLDKLAREINNKKTSLCKKVANDYNTKEELWKNQIDTVINSDKFSYLPMNKNYNNGLYDDSNTFTENSLNTITDKTNNTITDYSISDIDYKSVDSFFDDKSIDSYLDSRKNKKNVKFNKIVESINYDDCSKNDCNIFEHIKKCINCKNKLMNFLNKNDNIKKNKINDVDNIVNNIEKKSKINIKEIVLFLIIGIFIIFMLDILLRYKN
jgi:hypothetical protein